MPLYSYAKTRGFPGDFDRLPPARSPETDKTLTTGGKMVITLPDARLVLRKNSPGFVKNVFPSRHG